MLFKNILVYTYIFSNYLDVSVYVNDKEDLLFTALLNRGAGDNSCYHLANCQQRVITLLSSAKCQERDENSLL